MEVPQSTSTVFESSRLSSHKSSRTSKISISDKGSRKSSKVEIISKEKIVHDSSESKRSSKVTTPTDQTADDSDVEIAAEGSGSD